MRSDTPLSAWTFIDDQATFRLQNPDHTSYLYFPLLNEAGMMSCVTPTLNGDVKTGHNSFLTLPLSVEDLHNTRSARNFWIFVEGAGAWSATGNSAAQTAQRFNPAETDSVVLEAGFLWHRVIRENPQLGLRAEVTNFTPAGDDRVELMRVTLSNNGDQAVTITPTAAIPIYGRSADDLRDHRHVTSLLHRIRCHAHGVLVRPTLSFDERGHVENHTTYAILGATGDGQPPVGLFPVLEQFIGEGGSLDWPEAIVCNRPASHAAGDRVDGYEALGGLRFPAVTLQPGQSQSYLLILAILDEDEDPEDLLAAYGDDDRFEAWLARTKQHWQERLDALACRTGDPRFDGWTRWVTLQPTLRRLMGNSFLPYHDYGRGGRGWRDLWQDILALLLMEEAEVGDSLLSYFAGVRLDGSNATIIGSRPGEFKADRNNIPRVWMDHGAWPLLTVQLYLDTSGDLDFLLRKQAYFKDHTSHRCRQTDEAWQPAQGTQQRTASGQIYQGSVLEHLLVQHLTAFFHVGQAGNTILLEGADWNDGLDMARQRGESVAFSALYAGNLRQLSELALALAQQGITQVDLAEELLPLLDRLGEPLEYDSVQAKRQRLAGYFDSVRHTVSGRRVAIGLAELATDLAAKADWLAGHIRSQEWIDDGEGRGWFNGYYDDRGRRVEGQVNGVPRMTLTGQVFPLMAGVASDEQARQIVRAADRYLFDERVGGYRLNTDFGDEASAELRTSLGRLFGFAFGHKENGAMFSHMAVMFANALYRRGLAAEGWRVLGWLYRHCQDFAVSRIYPGLPEYVSPTGRGMYPYLTGSASWYLLTLVTEAFGVRGRLGDLELAPRLLAEQFDERGQAAITTRFAGRRLAIVYHNPARLDPNAYGIGELRLNGQAWPAAVELPAPAVLLPRSVLTGLTEAETQRLDLHLVQA